MKKTMLLLVIAVFFVLPRYSSAQETNSWSELDRQYLLQNLIQTRDSLVKETTGLSERQATFKEAPDRWSINQVVEHIAIWELLLAREITMSLSAGAKPDLNNTAKPDSVVLGFIMEPKVHISEEYTRPFTYTVPMGLNTLDNNIAWFLKMRDESIAYLKDAKEDLRSYYLRPGRSNVHQTYITVFGHTSRHLRQIRKIKQHADYPRKNRL